MLKTFNYQDHFNQYIKTILESGITISYTEFCIIKEFWICGFLRAVNGTDKIFEKENPGLDQICYMSYQEGYEIGENVKDEHELNG